MNLIGIVVVVLVAALVYVILASFTPGPFALIGALLILVVGLAGAGGRLRL